MRILRGGIVFALLTAGIFSTGFRQEVGTIALENAEMVLLRIWAPAKTVEESLPPGFTPAPFVFDPTFTTAPTGRVDVYLLIRSARQLIPVAGRSVEEDPVLDAFLMVPVRGSAISSGDISVDFWIAGVWTDNPLRTTVLANAGLDAQEMSGTMSARPLPNLSQESVAEIALAPHTPWRLTLRSLEPRAYDPGSRPWRLFSGSATNPPHIRFNIHDGQYWRAASRTEHVLGNTPFDRWPDWRWADNHALILFAPRATEHLPTVN